jgi:hypothetical protein
VFNYQDISKFAKQLTIVAQRSGDETIASDIQTRVSQLKNAVAHVDVFTTSGANRLYSTCSEYLKQQANALAPHYVPNDYLLSDAVLEHVKMDLTLIDPLAQVVDVKNPVGRELRLLVAHLNLLRDDVVQRMREQGDDYSFQALVNENCYLGLKTKLIDFLFLNGKWSERRSFELCLQGFNVTKPWEGRKCVTLSFDVGNVHHHAKIVAAADHYLSKVDHLPLHFKLYSFKH